MPTPPRSIACVSLSLLLAVLSSGCAQPSPPPPSVIVSSPRLPPPDPRLMTPAPPPESFSKRVDRSLQTWAERLEGLRPR